MQLIPKLPPIYSNYLFFWGLWALLLGRSWQAAFADLPWRAFFWNQTIWQPFLKEEDYLLFFQEDYINLFS